MASISFDELFGGGGTSPITIANMTVAVQKLTVPRTMRELHCVAQKLSVMGLDDDAARVADCSNVLLGMTLQIAVLVDEVGRLSRELDKHSQEKA
jgi:hypothetical protein